MTETTSHHSRESLPRPGDLSPLSRKELRGRSSAQSVHSRHSRESGSPRKTRGYGKYRPSGTATVHALLPVKDTENAKQRLSPLLDANERCLLFTAMLEDVLEALAGATSIAGILMVTRQRDARALADRYGANTLGEALNLGQTSAVTLGARSLSARGAAGMLAVPADIPLVRSEDIDALLSAHPPAPSVTIAPARDDLGSNAVACSPPEVLPFRFGENSFHPHLARARALGIEPGVVRRPRLALDIDTPADLRAFAAAPSPTRAYRYLEESGILPRLQVPAAATHDD